MDKKLLSIIVGSVILGISISLILSASISQDLTIYRDKDVIVSDILQECGRDDECVFLYIKKISETEPQDVVIYVANQVPLEWEKEDENCHVIAHHVSEFLLGYFNGNLSEAISHVGNACGNALYHGIVENYFSVKVLLEDVEVEELDITSPCMNVGSSIESNLHQQCVHGLGHSLAKVYDFDVFEAVQRCDEFENPIDQDRCSDGLFMENNNENFNNGGGSYDENNIFYPCDVVDEKYKFRCYFYQGYYVLRQNDYSYKQSFDDCKEITDGEAYIVRCIHAISQDMAIQFYTNEHEKIIQMCDELDEKYQWECIRISSNALTIYIDPEIGDDLCYLVEEELNEKCLDNWNEVIRQHSTV